MAWPLALTAGRATSVDSKPHVRSATSARCQPAAVYASGRAGDRHPSAPVPRVAWVAPRGGRAVPVRAASRCGGSDLSREQRKAARRARIRPEARGGWTPRNVGARDAIARNPPRCKLMLLREEFLK